MKTNRSQKKFKKIIIKIKSKGKKKTLFTENLSLMMLVISFWKKKNHPIIVIFYIVMNKNFAYHSMSNNTLEQE